MGGGGGGRFFFFFFFFGSVEKSSDSSRKQIIWDISGKNPYFIIKYMLCVFIRIASLRPVF